MGESDEMPIGFGMRIVVIVKGIGCGLIRDYQVSISSSDMNRLLYVHIYEGNSVTGLDKSCPVTYYVHIKMRKLRVHRMLY